jgi:hypothetical protein
MVWLAGSAIAAVERDTKAAPTEMDTVALNLMKVFILNYLGVRKKRVTRRRTIR